MILLEDKKAVIITPPHTGSGALHRQLCGKPGRYWVISRSYEQLSDHHGAELQAGWVEHDGFEVFVVVRDPIQRIAGLYHHYNWFRTEEGEQAVTLPQFRDMIDDLDWIYRTPIQKFIHDHIEYDVELINYESMHEFLDDVYDIQIDWFPNSRIEEVSDIYNLFIDHELMNDRHMRVFNR